MKKFLSTMAIFAMAAAVFTGCKKETEKTEPTGKAKLSIPAELTVAIDGTATLEITASMNASADIAIEVKSSDAETVSVDPASVTIKKGTKSAVATLKGLKEGSADITITTASEAAEISAGKCAVTVSNEPAPTESPIVTADIDYTTNPATLNDYAGFMLECPEYYDNSGASYTDIQTSCVWVHNYLYDGSEGTTGSEYYTTIDNYGNLVKGTANGMKIYVTLVEKDTPIKTDDMIENPSYENGFNYTPIVYSADYTANAGKSGYAVYVGRYVNEDGTEYEFHRMWAEISVSAEGAVTVGKVAMCTDDTVEFKAGQEK